MGRGNPISPGQESVWFYPRPAIAEPCRSHITITHGGQTIAETRSAVRTLETSHPPSYYIPPADIAPGVLRKAAGTSICEWKGAATYWDVVLESSVLSRVGWSYLDPTPAFMLLRDHVAFYAGLFDQCMVDGEAVTPQAGGFYGGWITSRVVGPFKGGPGTMGW
ncbi:MAG: DUF427 domain-containing protein [Afipia sp.]|nr:DUF427 domain-containing protein [Afipia sp.]